MQRKKKPKDLKSVKSIWYKKLKKSGFYDIEENEHKLKRYDADYFLHLGVDKATETSQYYSNCEEFLRKHLFFSKSDRYIWRLHCTGMTEVQIAKQIGVHESTISRVLSRLRKIMEDERSNLN